MTQQFSETLDAIIDERSLLKHPFYQAWNAGTLPLESLREYAKQYFHFEAAFPTFLSAIHARMEPGAARQAVLENLWDEEHGAGEPPGALAALLRVAGPGRGRGSRLRAQRRDARPGRRLPRRLQPRAASPRASRRCTPTSRRRRASPRRRSPACRRSTASRTRGATSSSASTRTSTCTTPRRSET